MQMLKNSEKPPTFSLIPDPAADNQIFCYFEDFENQVCKIGRSTCVYVLSKTQFNFTEP